MQINLRQDTSLSGSGVQSHLVHTYHISQVSSRVAPHADEVHNLVTLNCCKASGIQCWSNFIPSPWPMRHLMLFSSINTKRKRKSKLRWLRVRLQPVFSPETSKVTSSTYRFFWIERLHVQSRCFIFLEENSQRFHPDKFFPLIIGFLTNCASLKVYSQPSYMTW